jgi:glycosyltransferase involved in cell wall biosynthesis
MLKVKERRPKISVVIPVYNSINDLKRALQSVLWQTFQDFEIVVVDDGSEEDVKHVCDAFKDDRIRYLRNDVHVNANVARNRGLREAQGGYIAMLDADDEFLPGHLERRLKKMEEGECDGIFGSAVIFDGKKERVKKSHFLSRNETMADYLLTDGFCPTPSHFYRARAAREIMWDEDLWRNQDYDFSIRFAERFVFKCDPGPTVRVHWETGHKQKLGEVHFRSQKRFIEKHKKKISKPALVNYFYAMKKEAEETGNSDALRYYTEKLREAAPGLKLPRYLLGVKLRAVVNRFKML